jgi:hypothetical protein
MMVDTPYTLQRRFDHDASLKNAQSSDDRRGARHCRRGGRHRRRCGSTYEFLVRAEQLDVGHPDDLDAGSVHDQNGAELHDAEIDLAHETPLPEHGKRVERKLQHGP